MGLMGRWAAGGGVTLRVWGVVKKQGPRSMVKYWVFKFCTK